MLLVVLHLGPQVLKVSYDGLALFILALLWLEGREIKLIP